MGSIKVTFQDAKGNTIKTIEGNEGDDLLSLAHEHDVDLEGRSFSPHITHPHPKFLPIEANEPMPTLPRPLLISRRM